MSTSTHDTPTLVTPGGFPILPSGRLEATWTQALNGHALADWQWHHAGDTLGGAFAGYQPGAPINQAAMAIDHHPADVMNRTALRWLCDTGITLDYTYTHLKALTNQVANGLEALDAKRGDRMFVFLERVPANYISILGGLKATLIVGPLFSAFGPEALRDRLQHSGASIVITSLGLLPRLESILDELPALKYVLIVQHPNPAQPCPSPPASPLARVQYWDYNTWLGEQSPLYDVPETPADTMSIMHYTSGTTGKPKGAVHRHQALISQALTARWALDLTPGDVYWCTADPGWVTGTSYGIFGAFANGVTNVVYVGGFSPEHWYGILQNQHVNVWYTAPTAIRMLMKAGEQAASAYDFSALRHLASVGEPLNPEALMWGYKVFGKPFYDGWWQTELGSIHIANTPWCPIKPGSMGKPLPGIEAGLLDDAGAPLPESASTVEGHLAIRPTSPSFFPTYWENAEQYASKFQNGWYRTGDRAQRDAEGYYWFMGRDDDVINTAGHLVGPFEVESALVEHPAVAEAAVIGKPDPERLEVVKAFIALKSGIYESPALLDEIRQFVRQKLAAHAYPREITVLPNLPKTRSGKIMRRLLKARELGLPEGDVSTLEE